MARINFDRKTFLIIVSVLIAFYICNMFRGINGLTKNMKVVEVAMIVNDVKAGWSPVKTSILFTKNTDEINDVLDILQKPVFYKILPHLGPVPIYENDRYEIVIALLSENNELLRYYFDSQGHVKIERFDKKFFSKDVNVFSSSNITWFEKMMELYKNNKKNKKWIEP